MTRLVIKSLFVMTQNGTSCFYSEFSPKLNIVYGRNTSGKSTLLNSILYTFGINDVKTKLFEVLNFDLVFRLDFVLYGALNESKCTIIRDGEFVYIDTGDGKYKRFSGIGADNSAEHIRLKVCINEFLNCKLKLDSKGELKVAPLEAIFLPYFVSQDVGWVYLRKSFSNLDYYRNFKEDYLDYYLGIENLIDRAKLLSLESELSKLRAKIATLVEIQSNNSDIDNAIINDEMHPPELPEYIKAYAEENNEIATLEKKYIVRCNEASYLRERKNVLNMVRGSHSTRYIDGETCPTCSQVVPIDIECSYQFNQDTNDTNQQIIFIKDKLKTKYSEINQIKSKIEVLRKRSKERFITLGKRGNFPQGIQSWIDMKASIHLNHKVKTEVGTLEIRRNEIQTILKNMRTACDVQELRTERAKRFRSIFLECITDMTVKLPTDQRFTDIYSISAFPSQGVELHKTVMAYHFAFNRLIQESKVTHRLPFILDAIFKEDVDPVNKSIIMKFINKWKPADTQTILSIAESEVTGTAIKAYNSKHFSNSAHLICIGEATRERSFLEERGEKYQDLIDDTARVLYSI